MRLSLLLAVALLAAGCPTLQVSSDFDPAADFSTLKTYDWMARAKTTGDPRIDNNTMLDARVKQAVDQQLTARGFSKVASGQQADFLVGYHVTLDKKTSVNVINDTYNYPPGWYGGPMGGPYSNVPPAQVYTYQYDEGTLLLDVVDAKSKKLLWRGTATDEVNFKGSPESRQEKVNDAVTKMLANFPPKK
jgi:hypothetical protein